MRRGFIIAKFIMIVVLGGMVTYSISNINQNSTMNQGTQNSVDNFIYNCAQDIAGSMTDILGKNSKTQECLILYKRKMNSILLWF